MWRTKYSNNRKLRADLFRCYLAPMVLSSQLALAKTCWVLMMNTRNLVSFFIAVSLLSACGTETPSLAFQVTSPTDSTLQSQLALAVPRLLQACPGLNRYSRDLAPAQVSRTSMSEYEGGIELTFHVSTNPQTLPPPLNAYAADNSCYVTVSSDAARAYIGKRACHSICSGTWQENAPGLMGREYLL